MKISVLNLRNCPFKDAICSISHTSSLVKNLLDVVMSKKQRIEMKERRKRQDLMLNQTTCVSFLYTAIPATMVSEAQVPVIQRKKYSTQV